MYLQDNNSFEKSVFDSLKELLAQCGRNLDCVKVLGVAVSGGADSIALLTSLRQSTIDIERLAIKVVTVDHSIRSDGAGAADAMFVKAFCEKLGVECVVKKIAEGVVAATAKERGRGVEEAARHLRYNAFEEFAAETGSEFICLAHNKNDALETLLMRFLQGSDAAGIAGVRGKYLRPLLGKSRAQIEEYLRQKNISWRTDATNSDNNYLRNKIRNKLMPFLDENFEGWRGAVLQGGEKASLQREALEKLKIENGELRIDGRRGDEVVFRAAEFGALPVAVRQKAVYEVLDDLGVAGRVPYNFVRKISFWPESDFKKLTFGGVEARSEKDKLFVKKIKKQATESGFFAIINGGKNPFVVRSREVGDEVGNSSGGTKPLADIFSDWKVPENQRDKIPLVEIDGKIAAVLGCVLGYENWIVK